MLTLIIFGIVYFGLIFGRLPGTRLDRTGIALLGAIALFAFGQTTLPKAVAAVDFPTLLLLFAMMVVSAQLRLGGFYTAVIDRLTKMRVSPNVLLGISIFVTGLLSAFLTNDVVCFAVTPVLLAGISQRGWNPVPFLIGLACASNVGSAATIIGNPQNILIGQALRIPFSGFLMQCGVPAVVGLLATWFVVAVAYRGRMSAAHRVESFHHPPFNPWQTLKGLAVITMAILLFLFSSLPRDLIAISAAGLLLMSRRLHSRDVLELVDWHLLLLFTSLFILNRAVEDMSVISALMAQGRAHGIDVTNPVNLFLVTPVLSNLVSNVPAVMFLLPFARQHPLSPAVLALTSTLAGNLLVIGSVANLIVIEQCKRFGVGIGWREHARVGVPLTLLTLLIAGAWLGWIGSP